MFCTDNTVLSCNFSSFSNKFLIIGLIVKQQNDKSSQQHYLLKSHKFQVHGRLIQHTSVERKWPMNHGPRVQPSLGSEVVSRKLSLNKAEIIHLYRYHQAVTTLSSRKIQKDNSWIQDNALPTWSQLPCEYWKKFPEGQFDQEFETNAAYQEEAIKQEYTRPTERY